MAKIILNLVLHEQPPYLIILTHVYQNCFFAYTNRLPKTEELPVIYSRAKGHSHPLVGTQEAQGNKTDMKLANHSCRNNFLVLPVDFPQVQLTPMSILRMLDVNFPALEMSDCANQRQH